MLEDEDGRHRKVSADTLRVLLHGHAALRLLFLNACEGARSGEADALAGLAQSLVRQGIPAVVAMQFEVSDTAAITLAQEFYRALADRYPVDAALAEARKAVFVGGNPFEWGTPVLFSRSPDNQLLAAPEVTEETAQPAETVVKIDTGGGAYIGGNAAVEGDLIGRDKNIHGDEVHGDKVDGDKILGNKIVHIYVTAADRPPEPASPLLEAEIARQSFEPATVLIPAGAFWMGSDEGADHERPRHQVTLPAYRIGKYPVTNGEYLAFVRDQGVAVSPEMGWVLVVIGQEPPAGKYDHPVVGVSWDDALRYCAWLSEKTARCYRLPSEAEWEKAAGGEQGFRYPWGHDFDARRCNSAATGLAGTTDVHTYDPLGNSPYGCTDMTGNVWEWSNTIWGTERNVARFKYPYNAKDGREKLEKSTPFRELRICRGGSYQDKAERLLCATRTRQLANGRDTRRGFRVLMEV